MLHKAKVCLQCVQTTLSKEVCKVDKDDDHIAS